MTKIERDDGQSVQTAYEYTYTGDGVKARMHDYDLQLEFSFGCAIACGEQPLRTLGRPRGSNDPWDSVDDWLLLPDGQAVARHWTPPISQQQEPIDLQIYISYDLFGIPLIADQSSHVITSRGQGSSREHCEKLKEMLESLKAGVCKTPGRCLDPTDCKRFNDILYSFCYECQNQANFRLQCDIYASWYYNQSGCKGGNPFLPFPGRPFFPPVVPGFPVAPRPTPIGLPTMPSRPSPADWMRDNIRLDADCSKNWNGLFYGEWGHQACLACCNAAGAVNGWPPGRVINCKNICEARNP